MTSSHRAVLFAAAVLSLVPLPSSAAAEPPAGNRGLVVEYRDGADEGSMELAAILREAAIFDDLAAGLGEAIAFPRQIPVVFTSCGDVNAFYDPEEREVVMCYELLGWLVDLYSADGDLDEEDVGVMALNSMIFVFLHELGHGIIHNLDIPVTGREEDAVDDLAALLLMAAGDEGEAAVFSAIGQFGAMTASMDDEDLAAMPFWDEHSLDAQRMFSLACLIYGSDPERHGDLVGEDLLPEERAVRCVDEFNRKSRSWDRLLEKHVKE